MAIDAAVAVTVAVPHSLFEFGSVCLTLVPLQSPRRRKDPEGSFASAGTGDEWLAGDRAAGGKEKIMLERKKLEGFYRELQIPSRIEANTRTAQVQQSEEDAKSELTQS